MGTALQIDALWAGLNDSDTGQSYSGAIVGFFYPGTTTPKAVWYDALKTLPTTAGVTQVTLDSNGTARVFGLGRYKINIYEPTDTGLTTPLSGSIDHATYGTASFEQVDTIADLRNTEGSDGDIVYLMGYYAKFDRPARVFTWFPASTETDNGGTYIKVAGVDTGRWHSAIPELVNVYDFGAWGDGTDTGVGHDDTAALNAAYDYADATGKTLYIPAGFFRFTSTLEWDKEPSSFSYVNVLGDGIEKTVLIKDADVVGIIFDGNVRKIGGFQLTNKFVGDTSDGIRIHNNDNSITEAILVDYHGGNGIVFYNSTATLYNGIGARYNKGSGIIIDSANGVYPNSFCNANTFNAIDCLGNENHGFWMKDGDNNYNSAPLITVQQNHYDGIRIETDGNALTVYGEVNSREDTFPLPGTGNGTYHDIHLTSSSRNNFITIVTATSNDAIFNEHNSNIIMNVGPAKTLSISQVVPRTTTADADGLDVSIGAGKAGPGAVSNLGGKLYLFGGDSDGDTNRKGGDVDIRGGLPAPPVGSTEEPGVVYLQATNGRIVVGDGAARSDFAAIDFTSVTKLPIFPELTQAQRDAITPRQGMMAVVTDLVPPKLQCYVAGAWVSLH